MKKIKFGEIFKVKNTSNMHALRLWGEDGMRLYNPLNEGSAFVTYEEINNCNPENIRLASIISTTAGNEEALIFSKEYLNCEFNLVWAMQDIADVDMTPEGELYCYPEDTDEVLDIIYDFFESRILI